MVGGAGARPVLVTVDQFEEIFTLCDQTDREAFVANLAGLLEAGRNHRVIVTVREEFRSRIVGLEALGPFLDGRVVFDASHGLRGAPGGRRKARRARQPAVPIGVVDDLVKKVLGQPAALPLLQFTLRALWDRRDRNRVTWEVYRRVGDPLTALTTLADAFYEGLARETQDEVKRILLELVRVDELLEGVSPAGVEEPAVRGGAGQYGRGAEASGRERLRAHRLRSGDADPVVEVKHESLIRNWPRLVAWIDEKRYRRRERLALSQAADRWERSGRPREGLLTGWQLEAAESATELAELEKEFVQASIEAVDHEQREKEAALRREAQENRATANRFRSLLIATAVCASFAIAAFVYALLQSERSRAIESKAMTEAAQHRESVLQAMRQQPLSYVDEHLDLAYLLGIEGNRIAETEVEPELRWALFLVPAHQSRAEEAHARPHGRRAHHRLQPRRQDSRFGFLRQDSDLAGRAERPIALSSAQRTRGRGVPSRVQPGRQDSRLGRRYFRSPVGRRDGTAARAAARPQRRGLQRGLRNKR
jgi:hypothetical protein